MLEDHDFFKPPKQEEVSSWKKAQPVKTYSRKSLPASLPPPGLQKESPSSSLDAHRSRFGRAIKQRPPSPGFLVNDVRSIRSLLQEQNPQSPTK